MHDLASMLPLAPSTAPEVMAEHVRSARERGLPELRRCRAHRHTLGIAGGGPSLADTLKDLDGTYIAAINGTLRFLLDRGVVPHACGLLDPGAHIADTIVADRRVRYYVASVCHPSVFDKLKDCHVTLWHPSPHVQADFTVAGGCTMGLRWFNLGYVLGFRRFAAHGLDSSFRGGATHAYPDRADSKDRIVFKGRTTRANFMAQAQDFGTMLERWQQPDTDAVEISVHGDGLLQDTWKHARRLTRTLFKPRLVTVACVNAGDYLGRGREYVERLYRAVKRNVSLPFEFVCFTDDPGCRGARPLPHPGLKGWWNKLALFKAGVFTPGTRVVYLDLDTVAVGDIDWLLRYRGGFAMLGPFFKNVMPCFAGNQSGVMAWKTPGPPIFARYETLGFPIMPGGDQQFVNSCDAKPDRLQDLYDGSIASYRGACMKGVPKGVSLVCFHNEPRPHETELWNVAADDPQ